MSQSKAMMASEIEMTKVKYSDLKNLDNGAKIAYVNYGDGIQSIYLQTPELTFPFDCMYYQESEGSGKFSCKVSLKTDDNPEIESFVKKMSEFDEKIKSDAKKNSMTWFKKKSMSDEVIDDKYTPIVRHYKDPDTGEFSGKYPAQMGFKVAKRNGVYQCKFYDESKSKINVDSPDDEGFQDVTNLLGKGSSAKMLLQCTGLWFSSVGFGATWKAVQMLVKVPETLEEFAFRDDGEVTSSTVEVDETQVEDSDDSDDSDGESSEEEEEDEPVMVTKKKGGRKSSSK